MSVPIRTSFPLLGASLLTAWITLACHLPTEPHDDRQWDGGIVGSGNVIEETRSVVGVRGVSLETVARLQIVQGGSEILHLRGEDNLLALLETEVQGGLLRIRFPEGVSIKTHATLELRLDVSTLERIELSGVGDIELAQLRAPRLELYASGVGDVLLRGLELDELDLGVSGVGNVTAAGWAERQRVRLSGVGHYRAEALASREAEVSLNSVGTATVRVRDYLYAQVTGSGTIYYYGNPVVDEHVVGSGSVERLGG